MSESSKSKSDEHDSITHYHHLKFENRCLRASGDDFQNLFEAIMVRARPGKFERVRPYGKYGDRKCDGLIESEGTIFQVYSPDELKQAEVQKKIDEDLEGAAQHWRDTLKKWVFVYNVKRGIAADIKLTLQQKRQQYPDIEIACWSNDYLWEITRDQLSFQQRCEILGVPPQWNLGKPKKNFHVPNPPSHLLERSTDLDTLKNLLLSSSDLPLGIAESALKVGVYGMGGIGKSVLAGMLARDEEVQAAFPDGVFWIPLGQEPILTLKQLNFAQMLGDASLPFQDVQQGKIYLSQLLDNRQCLLILDDVWQVEHSAAFDVLSKQSKLLFTTRDIRIVKALNAIEYQVNLLSDDEALELLSTCSGQSKETLPVEAHKVMKECGNLPLALSMIGAIARARPNRWDNLLHKLQNADLGKIRYQFPEYPYPDLLKAIQVSIDALEQEVRIRYLEFAIFPEDVAIPEATLRTFWEPEGLDEYDTQDIIDVLVERSLARRSANGDLSLHDLQYDYVRKQATDLPALHNKLLDAYAVHCPQGWHAGPKDGYFFENLACHLKASERENELYSLLTESPEWMAAKFAACSGDSAYLADVTLALESFEEPLIPDQIVTAIQLCATRQVVYQRVSYYADSDLRTLIFWGREEEALNHARLRSDPFKRFEGLLIIYKTLSKKGFCRTALLTECFELTHSIAIKNQKVIALVNSAVAFIEAERNDEADVAFSEAKEVIETIDTDAQQAWALRFLAMVISQVGNRSKAKEYFLDSFKISKLISDRKLQVFNLTDLAVILVHNNYEAEAEIAYRESENIISTISDDKEKERALHTLATAFARGKEFERSRIVVREIQDVQYKIKALCSLAVYLWDASHIEDSKNVLDEVKQLANPFFEFQLSGEDDWLEAEPLQALATALAQTNNFVEAEEVADQIRNQWQRDLSLDEIAKALTLAKQFIEAERVARKIEDRKQQACTLRLIAACLAQDGLLTEAKRIFDQAGQTIPMLVNYEKQTFILNAIAIALAKVECRSAAKTIFSKARESAQGINADWQQTKTLRDLAAELIQLKYFNEAEITINLLKDTREQAIVLMSLATALAKVGEHIRAENIFRDLTSRINKSRHQSNTLSSLSKSLAQAGYFDAAVEIAHSLESELSRDLALRDLVQILIEAEKLTEAEALAKTIDSDIWKKVEALGACAIALNQSGYMEQANTIFVELQEAVRTAACDEKTNWAVKALISALIQSNLILQAKQLISSISDSEEQSWILLELAKVFAKEGRYTETKDLFESFEDKELKIVGLGELAATISQAGLVCDADTIFQEITELAFSIPSDLKRALAIRSLLKVLIRAKRFKKAQEVASKIDDHQERNSSLQNIAEALIKEGKFYQAQAVVQIIEDKEKQKWILGNITVDIMRMKNFLDAIDACKSQSIDDFIHIVASCSFVFESIQPMLSIVILKEIVFIAGWVNPGWQEVYEILQFAEAKSSQAN